MTPYSLLTGSEPRSALRADDGSFEDAVRRSVLLSSLHDLVAWGRKHSVWAYNFGLS